MNRPNFFIVGAPKCGTSSLHYYLKQHPEVFMPERKEPHFFGKDLRFLKGERISEAAYLSEFAGAGPRRCLGEASVWYLYSQRAAEEIHRFNPDARIIIMLRNPVDMMYSLHSQFLYECNEDLESFEGALHAEAARHNGLRIPRGIYFREGLYYHAVAQYTDQVRRYLDVFGPDRVNIVSFEDFKQDPLEVYVGVLNFLGVWPGFRPRVRVVNPNKEVRSRSLQFFLNNPPPAILQLSRWLLPTPLRHSLVDGLKRLNCRHLPRAPMDPSFRRRLEREVHDDVVRLEKLIGREFPYWLGKPVRKAQSAIGSDGKELLVGSGVHEAIH